MRLGQQSHKDLIMVSNVWRYINENANVKVMATVVQRLNSEFQNTMAVMAEAQLGSVLQYDERDGV